MSDSTPTADPARYRMTLDQALVVLYTYVMDVPIPDRPVNVRAAMFRVTLAVTPRHEGRLGEWPGSGFPADPFTTDELLNDPALVPLLPRDLLAGAP